MKKQILYPVVILSLILFLAFPLHADLVNYTFTVPLPNGEALDDVPGISGNADSGTFIEQQGFLDLANVTYTLQVDSDGIASQIRVNGLLTEFTDNANVDYFFADFLSGQIPAGGGVSGAQVQEFNYGATNLLSNSSQLKVGSGDSWLSFSSPSPITDWTEGFDLISLAMNTYNAGGTANSNLLISGVTLSDIQAVPLPAAFWFLGSGIVALLGLRKKKTI